MSLEPLNLLGAVELVVLVAFLFGPALRPFRRGLRLAPVAELAPEPPLPALRLLVESDEEAGLLRPTVDIRSEDDLDPAFLRIELVDGNGEIRSSRVAALSGETDLSEHVLGPFGPPDGTSLEEALSWRWVVTLESLEGEPVRWEHVLSRAGPLNPEAELELAR